MVILSTLYDKTLKERIFCLKGSERYASTTDVLLSLDTTFHDYDTHISNCRIGLIIEVLRCIGDGFVFIYNNDELLLSIPYSSSDMSTIIDSDWNDKGVYWDDTNKKLIIGIDTDEDTGLFLPYVLENNLKVKYTGNHNCLGSTSKTINFVAELPSDFDTSLSITGTRSYSSGHVIDGLSVTLSSNKTLSSAKSVKIYDEEGILYATVNLTQDVTTSVTLEDMYDGLHTIRAVWDGDNECYGTEDTLDISVGYVLSDITVPSIVYNDAPQDISFTIKDFLDNPVASESIMLKYGSTVRATATSDANGFVEFNDVELHGTKFCVYHNRNIKWFYPEFLNVTEIRLDGESRYGSTLISVNISLYDGDTRITREGIPLTLDYQCVTTDEETISVSTNRSGYYVFSSKEFRWEMGQFKLKATITDTDISNTVYVDNYETWYAKDKRRVAFSLSLDSAKLSTVENGVKLEYTSSLPCSMILNTDNNYNEVPYEVSIIYRGASSKNGIRFNNFEYNNIPPNALIELKRSNTVSDPNYYDVYVNGELRDDFANTHSYIRIESALIGDTNKRKGNYMIFDDLKIQKVFND